MSAVLSPCGRYRFLLSRVVSKEGRGDVLWVMLNPSTADAAKDDPTIRKCAGFSRAWGYRSFSVVNLYAYRATEPADLWKELLTPGLKGEQPEHWRHFKAALRAPELRGVVCAWGNVKPMAAPRVEAVLDLLHVHFRDLAVPVWCLGRTQGGHPTHPLMLAYSTPRVPFFAQPAP